MKKCLYSMLLLSAALGASAQDLEQRVSYTGPAAPAKKVLEALSAQVGFALSTSPQTAHDVLVVVAKDVKLGELLKRIAEADSAEWKQEAAGYRLIRTEALARDQQRSDVAERAKGFGIAAQRLLTQAEGAAFDAAAARRLAESARRTQSALETGQQRNVREPQGKDPAARALARLLADLPASTLASIPPHSRVVFTNLPNRMQKPLGPQAHARLLAFQKEQNLWARALADTPRETSGGNNQMFVFGGPDLSSKAIDRVGKALLVVQRFSDRPTLSIELKVSDSTGKFVARASETLAIETPAPTSVAASSGTRPINLSNTAKEFAILMAGPATTSQSSDRIMVRVATIGGGGGGGTSMSWSSGGTPPAPPVSEEWAKRLSQPEVNEPLDYVTGEVLRAVASDLGTALVASIPDGTLIPTCRRLVNANLTAEQFLGFAESTLGMKVSRSQGWTVLSAAFPSETRDTRVERVALGQLLRTAIKNTYLRLDEMASYALRQPDGLADGSFDDRFIRLLAPDASQDFGFNGADRRLMLKLYGTLNAAQRSTLVQGGGIPLGRMDSRQNALIAKMVFDSPSGPQIAKPAPPQAEPRGERQVETRAIAVLGSGGLPGGAMLALPGSDQELIDERTEALPFGVPGDGAMRLNIQSRPGALSTRKDGSDARFLSAEELASEMSAASRPELSEGSTPYTSFRMATIRTLDFQFALSPAASMARALRDAEIAGAAQPAAFDQLPAPFRQMVERQAEQMARAFGNVRLGGPIRIGGSPPPPPVRS